MFDIQRENEMIKRVDFSAPVSGDLIKLEEVNDEMFSSKIMGDGYAIVPDNGTLYAPINGYVISVFPTKHAICLRTEEGIEVLLHLGIDTVELGGIPFEIFVKEGEKVNCHTKIATMNIEYIKKAKKDTVAIVVILNCINMMDFVIEQKQRVNASDVVATCKNIY